MLTVICLMLVTHWIADHVTQPRWAARNKSKDTTALAAHIVQYVLVLTVCMLFFPGINQAMLGWYLLVNAAAHTLTDFLTSKASGYCYLQFSNPNATKTEQTYYEWLFWVVIGFDQLAHLLVLTLTLPLVY